MTIPWFFLWSEKYGVFCDVLVSTVSDKYFDLYPIEKPQKLFDQVTYKEGEHFLAGMYLKDYEIMELFKVIPENHYFIFSDADILVFEEEFNNFVEPLLKKDVDMFFMKENDTTVNVGFMILRNNNKVRNFFTNVIQELESLTTPLLDQTVINNLLKTFDGTYEVLDEKYIASNVNVDLHDKEVVKSICIFQPLCTANKNYKLNILEKLISFQYLFNINLNNYITDLSETLEGEDKAVFQFILSHYTSISSLEL
jgi:hypothetical protein